MICLVLPSRPLDGFILAEQVRDLSRSESVVVVPPPTRLRYGVTSRLPEPLARLAGRLQARRVVPAGDRVACVVIYHPAQWYLARGILAAAPGAELWYSRWDRYEVQYQTSPRRRRRLAKLHAAVASRSAMTLAVSVELQRLEREAVLVPLSADTFPALDVGTRAGVWRGPPPNWRSVRERAQQVDDTLLLVDAGTAPGDPDYEACRTLPNVIFVTGDRVAALADYALDLSG